MGARSQHREELIVGRAPHRGNGDAQPAGEILPGERLRGVGYLLRGARSHQMSTLAAGARAQIDHIVRPPDGFLVVLHHEHRVPQIAQLFQGAKQALVVSGVQADRRFVEHVEDPAELRANLRGQPDALAFPARQRGGGAVEAEVAKPHGAQKLQALADLVEDAPGQNRFARVEPDGADNFHFFADRLRREIGNGEPRHGDGQAFGSQALALALPARNRRHILLEPFPVAFRSCLTVPAIEERDDAPK